MSRSLRTVSCVCRPRKPLVVPLVFDRSYTTGQSKGDRDLSSKLDALKTTLTSASGRWRRELEKRRHYAMAQAGQQLSAAGLKLNEVTGYHEVERLKQLVTDKGAFLRPQRLPYRADETRDSITSAQRRRQAGQAPLRGGYSASCYDTKRGEQPTRAQARVDRFRRLAIYHTSSIRSCFESTGGRIICQFARD
jgi:hypothetical protein